MLDYEACLEFLYNQLPIFQRQGKVAFKKDLTNTFKLCQHLGHPERKFKSIHVAGTNGKGSVCHMLAATYHAQGYKTGLYTSPHLTDFRERIKVNGQMASKTYVEQFVNRHHDFVLELKPSFFELTVAMSFDYFAQQKVDIAIIETGMGGRLDSTNVISPLLSIITNIGLDHTQYLGETLPEIAFEKAGIIKQNTPVVIGLKQAQTQPVFINAATERNSKLLFAEDFCKKKNIPYPSNKPDYQLENAKTAFTALNVLKQQLPVSDQSVETGLTQFETLAGLRARWQVLGQAPTVIAEAAHNASGIELMLKEINKMSFDRLHLIFGTVNDKDLKDTFKLLPQKATYHLCNAQIPRALPSGELLRQFEDHGFNAHNHNSCKNALVQAMNQATDEDLIIVTGSFFVIAEVLEYLEKHPL